MQARQRTVGSIGSVRPLANVHYRRSGLLIAACGKLGNHDV